MGDECAYIFCIHIVLFLSRHVVWMSGNRWPIKCLMANEVESGFLQCRVALLLFLANFMSLIISNDVCVGFDSAGGDVVVECF